MESLGSDGNNQEDRKEKDWKDTLKNKDEEIKNIIADKII